MASEIRVNKSTNRSGLSTVTYTDSGPILSGITTIESLKAADITASGNVNIAGVLTYEDVTNVDSVGVVTARSNLYVGSAITCYASTGIVSATAFHGDAANLTNLPASAPVGTGTDRAFFLNDKVILSSYEIPAEKNAGTFGPVQVAAAKTVTIPSGSVWTIV